MPAARRRQTAGSAVKGLKPNRECSNQRSGKKGVESLSQAFDSPASVKPGLPEAGMIQVPHAAPIDVTVL
jgi:hypothetical protein